MPPAALAVTAAAAMACAAPTKPWRYYYVLAFPLSNALSKEKLSGMLELTDSIERHEEAYLYKMADREAHASDDNYAPPLPRHVARILCWLSALLAVLALVAVALIYRFQNSSAAEDLDPSVATAAFVVAAAFVTQNAALACAVLFQNALLLRGAVFVLSLSVGCIVFVLDEMDTVLFSQRQLAAAIEQPRVAFTSGQVSLVLNGGASHSLWHRFFVDGPTWFLLWIDSHCVQGRTDIAAAGSNAADDGEDLVDSVDFFTPFWHANSRNCVRTALSTHLQVESILHGVLTSMVVALAVQLVLAMLLLWLDQLDDVGDSSTNGSIAVSRRRKRHHQSHAKNKASARNDALPPSTLPFSFAGIVRLASAGLALSGCALVVAGLTLLSSCSFVGSTESWSLALVVVFGSAQVVVGVFTAMLWKQQLMKVLLVGSLALESYVCAGLADFCASLSPPLLGQSRSDDSTPTTAASTTLRGAFDVVFQQMCPPMKRWRLHVCVEDGSVAVSPRGEAHAGRIESAGCQDEFAALLRTTAQHSITVLMWMMAAQVVALVWLSLPSVRSILRSIRALVCCQSTRKSSALPAHTDHQKGDDGLENGPQSKRWKHSALELVEARQRYLDTVKQRDSATLQAEAAAFDAEWAKMSSAASGFQTSELAASMIFSHQFEAITRTLVLRRLTNRCKVDVSLGVSRDGKLLFAKIFASDNLLMTTLCQCGPSYTLQFADAIDPGDGFWRDRREIKNDGKVLDTHTVHQKLKLLLLHGVVTRKEAQIFPSESMARVSARVHALMRIHRSKMGTLTPYNRHAPFVSYMPHTQLQYLYKKYPNRLDTAATAFRRSAVLRTIDSLRLTRQILDAEFDLDLMQRQGLIHDFAELHSASRFDLVSKQSLLASWIAFWRPHHLPGEYEPQTHWLLNQLGRVSPFRQPLQAVRDYFGECIAFYFAWLAFYNQQLLLPTLVIAVLLATQMLNTAPLGALIEFCTHRAGSSDRVTHYFMDTSAVVLGLAMAAWGLAFVKAWQRRSEWFKLEWGMADLAESTVGDRANFRGTPRRNPVTQQQELHFPGRERMKRQVASALVLAVAGATHLVVCMLLLCSQGLLAHWIGLQLGVGLSCLAVALLVLWNGDIISVISHQLSEWENHHSESAFQRSVVFKVCVLQAFNSYGPLLLVAFVLYHASASLVAIPLVWNLCEDGVAAFQQNVAPHVGVVLQLQLLLVLIFGTRIASHLLLVIRGLLRLSVAPHDHTAPPSVESELALQAYRGSYEDYTEIVVQFGLVVMFSGVFPLAPAFAFVECALEMRLDALDLCLFLRRPAPEKADGIGPWATCLRAVLKLGALVHLALLYFMADNYAHWSSVRRVGAFLASGVVVWIAMELAWNVVPSKSRAAREVLARHAFLVDRYFGGDAGSVGDATAGRHAVRSDALSAIERKSLDTSSDENDLGAIAEGAEATPANLEERLALLRRLNMALRKNGGAEPVTTRAVEEMDGADVEHEQEEDDDGEEERPIVGYFVRSHAAEPLPLPSPSQIELKDDGVTAATATTDPLPPPAVAVGIEHSERAALTQRPAIHATGDRGCSDFAHATGSQPHGQSGDRRSSFKSFTQALFKKRRQSTRETPPPPPLPPPRRGSTPFSMERPPQPRRGSRVRSTSSDALPVVQLSGLEAVHEAARRDQFDFSTDRACCVVHVLVWYYDLVGTDPTCSLSFDM